MLLCPTSATAALCYALLSCGLFAFADTEIRNFQLPLPSSRLPPPAWPVTQPVASGSSDHNVSNASPELWLSCTPGEAYRSWTARLSWPASAPTKFDVELSSSGPSDSILIHISSSPLSPRISGIPFPNAQSRIDADKDDYFTPFALTLEPLLLGVLPRTAVPALVWIAVFGLGAACTVPALRQFIEKIHASVDAGPDDGTRKTA